MGQHRRLFGQAGGSGRSARCPLTVQPAGPCLVGYLAQSGATLGAGLQGAPAPAARREAASIKWVPRAPMELRCRAHGRRPTRRWEQEEALVRVVTVVAEPGVSAEAATAEVRGGTLQLQVTAKMGTYSALVTLAHPVAVEGRLPVGDALPRRWAPTHLRVRQRIFPTASANAGRKTETLSRRSTLVSDFAPRSRFLTLTLTYTFCK